MHRSKATALFDYFVGEREQLFRNGDTARLGGLFGHLCIDFPINCYCPGWLDGSGKT